MFWFRLIVVSGFGLLGLLGLVAAIASIAQDYSHERSRVAAGAFGFLILMRLNPLPVSPTLNSILIKNA